MNLFYRLKYKVLPLQLHVCSFGGSGTTNIMKFFCKYLNVNHPDNLDDLKHCSFKKVAPKAIYVFGDPRLAVVSIFKRNQQWSDFAHNHALKMGNVEEPKLMGMTIEEYLNTFENDIIGFESQFNSWTAPNINHDILYVRFEKIWDNLNTVFDFLEIPSSKIKLFPHFIKRSSSIEDLSPLALSKLNSMYSGLIENVEKLPDIKILTSKQ